MIEEDNKELNNETNSIKEKYKNEKNKKEKLNKKNYLNIKNDTGFYDKKYYEKLELIGEILEFIKKYFKQNDIPFNENIIIDFKHMTELKELIKKLFSYFNVLPPMQKKCIDKNIYNLINNNVMKVSDYKKLISFIERDVKKAKYNLISKKDLYDLLKKRGLE